jgi:hypothetical protein
MVRTRLAASRSPGGRIRACLAVALLTMGGLPAAVHAESLTVRFNGTVDLSVFGGAPVNVFDGSVTWDPDSSWVPQPGCPDFCLDGAPGAVSATFEINGVDYIPSLDRFSPFSRFIVWGNGGISLDLVFAPPLDVDGGAAPDVLLFSLNLFSDPPDYSLLVDGQLPDNLLFLSKLNSTTAFFSETIAGVVTCEEFMGACADADTLAVAPEPASMTLLVMGLSAAGWSAWRRRRL